MKSLSLTVAFDDPATLRGVRPIRWAVDDRPVTENEWPSEAEFLEAQRAHVVVEDASVDPAVAWMIVCSRYRNAPSLGSRDGADQIHLLSPLKRALGGDDGKVRELMAVRMARRYGADQRELRVFHLLDLADVDSCRTAEDVARAVAGTLRCVWPGAPDPWIATVLFRCIPWLQPAQVASSYPWVDRRSDEHRTPLLNKLGVPLDLTSTQIHTAIMTESPDWPKMAEIAEECGRVHGEFKPRYLSTAAPHQQSS